MSPTGVSSTTTPACSEATCSPSSQPGGCVARQRDPGVLAEGAVDGLRVGRVGPLLAVDLDEVLEPVDGQVASAAAPSRRRPRRRWCRRGRGRTRAGPTPRPARGRGAAPRRRRRRRPCGALRHSPTAPYVEGAVDVAQRRSSLSRPCRCGCSSRLDRRQVATALNSESLDSYRAPGTPCMMGPMVDPRAGTRATDADLVDVAALLAAYHDRVPDPEDVDQQVAFGTSGHRGSSLKTSFNEHHILATTQAICDYRARPGLRRAVVHRSRHPRALRAGVARRRSRCCSPTTSRCWSTAATGSPRPRRSRTRSCAPTAGRPPAPPTGSSSPPRTTRRPTAASSTTRPTAARPTPTPRRSSPTAPTS